MQNAARALDAGTRHHRDLVDHSTFAAADLRAAWLPRLALACRSLTAAHMKGDAAIASGIRRRLSEQQLAAQQLRTLAKPYRFRVQADIEGFPIIPGRYGQIEWFDDHDLAVYTNRPRLFAKLWAIPGVRRHQTGDTEMRAVFPPEALEQVATVIKARRRRTFASEEARRRGFKPTHRATSSG